MTPEQKQKIIAAQTAAILKKIAGGKPATKSELEFLNEQCSEPDSCDDIETDMGADEYAKNANDLANRIGVHRQLIAYHKNRASSPKDWSILAWKKYLAAFGKLPTLSKLQNAGGEASDSGKSHFDCDTAFAILFDRLSDALPVAIQLSTSQAGVKLSPRKHDLIAWNTWLILAATYSAIAHENGAQGPFDPIDGTGNCEYPTEIRKLAGRVSEHFSKPKIEPDTATPKPPETPTPEG